jgi:hypothetical protein
MMQKVRQEQKVSVGTTPDSEVAVQINWARMQGYFGRILIQGNLEE